MRIEPNLTDDAVLAELGRRLARRRLERNLTQQQVAEEAGLARRVVVRAEAGEPIQLVSFVRVLRVLGLLEALDRVLPADGPSPLELLEMQGHGRQRATGARQRSAAREQPGEPWRWGDER